MKPADPKDAITPPERDKLLAELKEFQEKLKQFQGESPLIFPASMPTPSPAGSGLDGIPWVVW